MDKLSLDTHAVCLCGSGLEYGQCCAPFHAGDTFPTTAEALMRSRFTAYALDNTAYILATWAGAVPSEKVDFSQEELEWQRLEIISTKKGKQNDSQGSVEFKAFYAQAGEAYVLHEMSRFTKSNGHWQYVDGVIKTVGKIILSSNQGKNAPCSCGSGKKYKRCCGAA